MAAFVSVAAGAEPVPTLRAVLAAAGVAAGIDEVTLGALGERLADPSYAASDVQVASGAAPTAGRDGYVEAAFEQGLAPGRLSDDGHMDFFERGLLKSALAEQVVATVVRAEQGQSGYNVLGETLPARSGGASRLKLGSGVSVDAVGVVRARHAGVILYKPGEALDVVSQHVHVGAVDLHSGHLETQGSLKVQGDIERLLQVRASGDVEVLGSVSGGSIRAGGSIRVTGNVRGGDGSRVVAGHDATLKSCEAAEVTAGGALRVQEAVNSRLAGQHVVVAGRLRGGAAVAERSLVVKEAGNAAGTPTTLHAGEPLELPNLEEVQRAVLMQKLRRMAERGGVRDAFGNRGDARGKGGKLGRVDAALTAEETKACSARAEHRAELLRAAVIVLGVAHAGVELRIGTLRISFEQTVRGLRYALDPETGELRAERTVA